MGSGRRPVGFGLFGGEIGGSLGSQELRLEGLAEGFGKKNKFCNVLINQIKSKNHD